MDTRAEQATGHPFIGLQAEAETAGVADVEPIKRAKKRFQYHTRLDVAPASEPEAVQGATLHNLSGVGIALRCRAKFRPGDHILLRPWPSEHEAWTPAVVVHCTKGVGDYLIGARFRRPVPDGRNDLGDANAARDATGTAENGPGDIRDAVRSAVAAERSAPRSGVLRRVVWLALLAALACAALVRATAGGVELPSF